MASKSSTNGDSNGNLLDDGAEERENEKEKEGDKKDEQDVVFVQDVGFTVKITAPGVEPFDIQVRIKTPC